VLKHTPVAFTTSSVTCLVKVLDHKTSQLRAMGTELVPPKSWDMSQDKVIRFKKCVNDKQYISDLEF
jgi:hypothetical protein